jgi:NTP pyrophosphatase (non-canonical NTP hydrolase)
MMDIDTFATRTDHTAIYPMAGGGGPTALMYCALGLAGEAGEVANKIKKVYRDGAKVDSAIAAEIGDTLWYACRLLRELNLRPSDILDATDAKLTSRAERDQLRGSGDQR